MPASGRHPDPPASPPDGSEVTARRVLLTVLIIGGAVIFMVLPWVLFFHAPEKYAGWAAIGVVMAVALHLFLSNRRRRKALEEMVEREGDEGDQDDVPPQ